MGPMDRRAERVVESDAWLRSVIGWHIAFWVLLALAGVSGFFVRGFLTGFFFKSPGSQR